MGDESASSITVYRIFDSEKQNDVLYYFSHGNVWESSQNLSSHLICKDDFWVFLSCQDKLLLSYKHLNQSYNILQLNDFLLHRIEQYMS